MQTLDIDAICQRIAVRPPYFAFRNLDLDDDSTVHGSFVPEQPLEFERGPVSAAELGRHLAILGACAASAFGDNTKIYHLATEAHYSRIRDPLHSSTGEALRASAKVVRHGKRDLAVETAVSDGVPFATLNVRYQILTESLFARFFEPFRSPTGNGSTVSPYAELLPLQLDPPTDSSVSAHSTALSPESCAGHFPDYPAWPVALIMHSLGRVAGRLLQHLKGQDTFYTVIHAHVLAETLAFASQPLTFHASLNSAQTQPSDFSFTCRALHNETLVASLETLYRVQSVPPPIEV